MRDFSLVLRALALVGAGSACGSRANVQCEIDPNCNLTTGGICAAAPSGNHWCAYPDPRCPSGLRYSDLDVGDGLATECVGQTEMHGDAGPGAGSDGGSKPNCKLRVAFDDGAYFFNSPNREVWITNIDGSEAVNVSNAPTADNYSPSWSPDGQKVAFVSNRRGVYDIYAVNADGTNLINLTPNSSDNNSVPVWSPDSRRIAFYRSGKVWAMNADGTGAAPISDRPVLGIWLAWSPDAKKLVFNVPLSASPGTIPPEVLYVAPIDNSAMPARISSVTNGFESHVGWAPAPKIVWDFNQDIFVANADGTALLNVTQDGSHWNTTPKLSPDGKTIVFGSDIAGNAELWLVATSGGDKTPLTHNTIATTHSNNFGDFAGSISSDNSLVAFSRVAPGSTATSNPTSSIGVVDIHGMNTHMFNAPGGAYAHSPTFSPCSSQATILTLRETR